MNQTNRIKQPLALSVVAALLLHWLLAACAAQTQCMAGYAALLPAEAIPHATLIVIGNVTRVTKTERQATPEFFATVLVAQAVRGTAAIGEPIRVRMVCEPYLTQGEEVLLLLEGQPSAAMRLVGGPQGVYHLTPSGKATYGVSADYPGYEITLTELLALIASRPAAPAAIVTPLAGDVLPITPLAFAQTTLEPTLVIAVTANDWRWVAPSPGQQHSPQIAGDMVVWVQEEPGAATGATSRLWAKALTSGPAFAITAAPGRQEQPAIASDFIVWQDSRNACPTCERDIYGYQVSTRREFAIAVGPNDQVEPAIDGSLVVWKENNNTPRLIRGRDLISAQEFELVLTGDEHTTYGPPALANHRIVYSESFPDSQDHRVLHHTIYAYDHQTGVRTVIRQGMGWPLPTYAIAGNRIAWSGQGVALFDLATGLTRSLPAPSLTHAVDIEGDLVVWTEEGTMTRIVGYDLAHNTPFVVAESAGSRLSRPRLSGATVVWMSERAGIWNIAVHTRKVAR